MDASASKSRTLGGLGTSLADVDHERSSPAVICRISKLVRVSQLVECSEVTGLEANPLLTIVASKLIATLFGASLAELARS